MARTDPQVNFRMPQALRDELERASRLNNRTLSAEIVARLSASFEQVAPPSVQLVGKIGDGPTIVDEVARALEDVQEVVAELRQLRRVEQPPGTPVRSDPMAWVKHLALAVEAPKRKGRPVARPQTSIAGSKKLRARAAGKK